MLVENVSACLRVEAPLTESEFLAAVCEEADCELLLDVNNLYPNQVNPGLDAAQAIASGSVLWSIGAMLFGRAILNRLFRYAYALLGVRLVAGYGEALSEIAAGRTRLPESLR